jgi:DNA-binding transcriptional ArsR family regulator
MGAPAEGVFAALADPTRWRVLSLLAERGEGTATSLAGELPVSRVAVVKHLAVLDRAGLVEGRRQGREVRYAVRPDRLDAATRWLARVAAEWDGRLAAIKRLAEAADEA